MTKVWSRATPASIQSTLAEEMPIDWNPSIDIEGCPDLNRSETFGLGYLPKRRRAGEPGGPARRLLQKSVAVRSERMLMQQIDDNLLFHWFVGLEIDAAVWHPTVFTHNRDRLLETEVAHAFLSGLLALKPVKRLLSSDPFASRPFGSRSMARCSGRSDQRSARRG